ncbi:hypothetical protein OsccyDRAFT_4176 [Leptolyngbyaceae cyanobacterium JSC-12]|nr:hypothetical protein OsccyDRAFT_4176 [Leptolyngbyaceae cyanobacterium JSC-12]
MGVGNLETLETLLEKAPTPKIGNVIDILGILVTDKRLKPLSCQMAEQNFLDKILSELMLTQQH